MSPVMPDTSKVVVGFAVVYYKIWDPLTPATLPADTLGLFEPWPGWTYVGCTEDGWKLSNATQTTEHRIEEQATPVDITVESKAVTIAGNLAQDTLQSISLAYGGGTISVTAAASGQPGKKVFRMNNELLKVAVGFEAKNSFGLPRRILVPKSVPTTDGETTYRRSANKRTYPVTMNSLCAPEDIQFCEIEAPALP